VVDTSIRRFSARVAAATGLIGRNGLIDGAQVRSLAPGVAWVRALHWEPNIMTHRSIRIEGRVIERASGQPVEGLRIEAWDEDMLVDDFVGRAERTDAGGRFTIRLEDSYFAGLFGERRPDLYFRLFEAGTMLARTAPLVRRLGRPLGDSHEVVVEVEIAVDRPATVTTPSGSAARRVTGCVHGPDGAAVAQLRVQVCDARSAAQAVIGEALTDPDGRYAIVLAARPEGESSPDPVPVVVQVRDPLGALLASTSTRLPPRADAAVDLTLGRPWRPQTGLPGRLVEQCHIDLPSDDVVERAEFERFFRLNATYGDLMDKPVPTVVNLPPQPGTPPGPDPARRGAPSDGCTRPSAGVPPALHAGLEARRLFTRADGQVLRAGARRGADGGHLHLGPHEKQPGVVAVLRAGAVDRGIVHAPRHQRCGARRRPPERLRDDDARQGGVPGRRRQRRPEDGHGRQDLAQ
jgi:hypothetical protein